MTFEFLVQQVHNLIPIRQARVSQQLFQTGKLGGLGCFKLQGRGFVLCPTRQLPVLSNKKS
jgi:hypothetical protein